MSAGSRLAALEQYINAEDPYNRLSGRVYLDTQALIQWVRLGVFEKILRMLPQIDAEPRFQIQDAVFNEAAGVLSGRFGAGSRQAVSDHLLNCQNLLIDGPVPSFSSLGARVTDLQDRIFVEAEEDPNEHSARRHLGEAETLAVMEIQAPGAVFVTADKDAIAVARSAGIGQPVRPFAFVAGVIETMSHVREFWEFTCYGRDCVLAGVWKDECVSALECSDFNAAGADRSPINPKILGAADALRWMLEDTKVLVAVLESRGE